MDSDDYHDYVIQDGEFVGAFEEMYRNCPDPWHQDSEEFLKQNIALTTLAHYRERYATALDVGCGKGRFSNRLQSMTDSVVGMDISPTALETARSRCPESEFVAADAPPLPFRSDMFELVVTSELLWYVLSDIEAVFSEIQRVLAVEGHYLLVQYFPDDQSYGNEVMESIDELLDMVPLHSVEHIEQHTGDGTTLVGLFELI